MEESLSLSRRTGKQTEIAEALVFLGWIARERGDYDRAEAVEVEALALYQAEQHTWGCGLTLLSLGETALDRGDLTQAAAYCEELRVLWRHTGQVVLHIRAMLRLGRIAYLRAEYDNAQTLLEECRVQFQQIQTPSAVAEAQFELGRLARARGDELAAAQQLTASLVGYREYWGNKREIIYCLEELAGLAATTKYPVRAAACSVPPRPCAHPPASRSRRFIAPTTNEILPACVPIWTRQRLRQPGRQDGHCR